MRYLLGFHLTGKFIRTEFGLSVPDVQRWRLGFNIPGKCFFKTSFPLANLGNFLSRWPTNWVKSSSECHKNVFAAHGSLEKYQSRLESIPLANHSCNFLIFTPINLLNLGDFCWTDMEIQYLRGFSGKKKGIQVGSKLEDLIVSVVIFGHPFDKYAQVKFDHETPKIIKKSGYHQKFLKPPPSAMNHQVSLENSKSYQAVPGEAHCGQRSPEHHRGSPGRVDSNRFIDILWKI